MIGIVLLILFLVFAPGAFAQTGQTSANDFYNRDSSGYSYRIGPVPPKIEQDWQIGVLPRDFTFGINPSGIDVQSYVRSLMNLPSIQAALRLSCARRLYMSLQTSSKSCPSANLPAYH